MTDINRRDGKTLYSSDHLVKFVKMIYSSATLQIIIRTGAGWETVVSLRKRVWEVLLIGI
jgi:hypothetical protein